MMYRNIGLGILVVPVFAAVGHGQSYLVPTSYTSEFIDDDFTYYTIDQNLEVGVIPGSHGVSATGGAQYTIPIQLPPGTNGVQPQLAVTYNSQGGDGIMGTGWQLSGTSAIMRVGRDWYHDEFTKPVTLTDEDRFALNGQLLVMTSTGTDYGEEGSEYDTEAASFSKFLAVGTHPTGGPDHFIAIAKDGTFMEFGKTAFYANNSKVTLGGKVYAWLLDMVRDPHGNYVRYHYEENELEHVLTRVEYTGNLAAGILPYNAIEFDYMLRDDVNEQFIAGYGRKRSHLLKQIRITCEGQPFKRYGFDYVKRDIDKSYLQQVREYGSDDVKQLNPTRIKYGDPSAAFSSENTGVTSSSYITSADYDGDGDAELLVTEYTEDEDGNRFNTSMKVFRRDGVGSYTQSYTIPLGSNYLIQNEITDMDVPRYGKFGTSSDINGDGRDDIVLLNLTFDGYNHTLDQIVVHYSDSHDATSFTAVTYPNNSGFPTFTPSENSFVIGDFDGDGKSDIVLLLRSGANKKAFIWRHDYPYLMTSSELSWSETTNSIFGAKRGYAVDVDGDGADEWLSYQYYSTYWNGDSKAFKLQPGTNFFETVWTYPLPNTLKLPGEFNGDGKADMLVAYPGGDIHVLYATGNGFFDSDAGLNIDWMGEMIFTGDFNGDGLTDVAQRHEVSPTEYELRFWYWHGHEDGFSYDELVYSAAFGLPIITNDVNGDGRMEILNKGAVVENPIVFIHPEGHQRSVRTVMNGLGNKVNFNYSYLTDPEIYEIGSPDRTYPNVSIEPAFEAVATVRTPDGIGGEQEVSYTYGFGRTNQQGKGFAGFGRTNMANEVMNSSETRQSDFDDVHAIYVPSSEFSQTWGLQPIRTVTHASEIEDIGDRYFIKVLNTVTYDHLLGATTETTNTDWDAYGNIGSTITDVNGIESAETRVLNFGAYGPSEIPCRPEEVVVIKTRGTEPAAICTTSYLYDNNTGRIDRKIEFAGTTKALSTDYFYHPTGNLFGVKDYFSGLGPWDFHLRNETYDAEPKYRFPTELSRSWHDPDPAPPNLTDVVEQLEYDPKWGKPVSVLSADGLTTLNEYDEFGRLVLTSVPHVAGTERFHITVDRGWDITSEHVYYETVSHPGEPDVTTWYDRLGREVKTEIEGFNGSVILASKTYDARGNVQTTTAPHLAGEDELVTGYTYHVDYNWLETSENVLTQITTTQYTFANECLTTTVTNAAGQSSSTTKDATGRTIAASDDGGDLSYTYDSWGNLLEVKLDHLIIARNEYDEYGRQISLDDANAGLTAYEYNAFGQLVYQKDANGMETELEYDNLGRLVRKSGDSGITEYTYFHDGNMVNDNPVVITGPEDVTFQYAYDDPYNRLTSETRMIDGEEYTTNFAYDPYDHISEIHYPSQLEVRYYYGSDGSLQQVDDPGGTVFLGMAQNGLGQWIEYGLRDGNTMAIEHHFGIPTRYHADGAFLAQDLNMVYDYVTGNMLERTDDVVGASETFTYDDLNRLTSAEGTYPTMEYGYTTWGNLITKGDVGQFSYGYVNKISGAFGFDFPTPPDDPPLVISQETQDIAYTAFSKVRSIDEVVGGSSHHLEFTYGPDEQRATSYLEGDVQWKKIYVGGYERLIVEGEEYEIHYINGGAGLCAIIVHDVFTNNWTSYAVYKDHLGSILGLSHEDGSGYVARQSFDPWGRPRNPDDWSYDDLPEQPAWLYRGYTGHEHVEPFALINMNGRMYDPVNGRMLSPDDHVVGGTATQAFNRYSYANNNPLSYIDPSGEIVFLAVVGIVGAISGMINVAANWDDIQAQGGGWDSFGRAASYFGVGFGVGALGTIGGAALAPVIGTGAIAGIGFGAAGGFTAMTSNTLIKTGGDWDASLQSGAQGAMWGALTGGLIAGGFSTMLGYNFWTGMPRPQLSLPEPDVFRPGSSPSSGPSWRFGDAYDIWRSDFWKLGYNANPKVQPGVGDIAVNQTQSDWNRTYSQYSNSRFNGRVVTNPEGSQVAIDIPSSYSVRWADNGNGLVYQAYGSTGNANSIRIMGPTNYAPNGYAVFYNANGQAFNPVTGLVLSKANWHFLAPTPW